MSSSAVTIASRVSLPTRTIASIWIGLLSGNEAESFCRLMKAMGQRYVQYVNRTYRRSGTLWEGRYRSCLTQQETYLLACMRYIELNPVYAAMVVHPGGISRVELSRQCAG